jgi:hypothetical protein
MEKNEDDHNSNENLVSNVDDEQVVLSSSNNLDIE